MQTSNESAVAIILCASADAEFRQSPIGRRMELVLKQLMAVSWITLPDQLVQAVSRDIRNQLAHAQLIVFLISPQLLQNEFITEDSFREALAEAALNGASVRRLLLRPVAAEENRLVRVLPIWAEDKAISTLSTAEQQELEQHIAQLIAQLIALRDNSLLPSANVEPLAFPSESPAFPSASPAPYIPSPASYSHSIDHIRGSLPAPASRQRLYGFPFFLGIVLIFILTYIGYLTRRLGHPAGSIAGPREQKLPDAATEGNGPHPQPVRPTMQAPYNPPDGGAHGARHD